MTMSSEPPLTEMYAHAMNESPIHNRPELAAEESSEELPLDEELLPDSVVEDDDAEALSSKAATLLIDAPIAEIAEVPAKTAPPPNLKYVQGVVQGQQAYLITNLLPGDSQTLLQAQMVWTVGRNRDAAIPLQDRAMSRRHAVLLYVPNVGFQLIDLNSMNGSFINGKRIQQRSFLRDGDRIRLGSTDFTFFVSRTVRHIGAIHPEVLMRLNNLKSRSERAADYLELEEAELLFKRMSGNPDELE